MLKTIAMFGQSRDRKIVVGVAVVLSIFVLATATSAMSTIKECCQDKEKMQSRYNFYGFMTFISVIALVIGIAVLGLSVFLVR